MIVSLRTYGGLTGGLGRPAHVVDTADLDDTARTELQRLVAAAVGAPRSTPNDQVRDAQTYEIEIEDRGTTTVLEAADGSVSPEFAALRDWLRNH
ncbi:protealysin inhibitor emfourin [Mycolicibacterium vaccae]|uniref:protealysin inhibitor emfourin n=1 Tax=Mycolicibacterium vaccae TaxID=1810 RepID=UPI003CF80E63